MPETREHDDANSGERSPKRRKVVEDVFNEHDVQMDEATTAPVEGQKATTTQQVVLPPSHSFLGTVASYAEDGSLRIKETDVGISEYVGHDVPRIEGIIKQR